MRAAVQGESRLKSMPNNTCIMISFAACFAIYLSAKGSGTNGLATSIKILIEESAGVLERIGGITPHRNGTSKLYGRQLRHVVGSELKPRNELSQIQLPLPRPTYPIDHQSNPKLHLHAQAPVYQLPMETLATPGPPPSQMSELLQFSAMSDDQINEAINNAGDVLEMAMPNFQMDDRTGLDWLNWFNMDMNV